VAIIVKTQLKYSNLPTLSSWSNL